MSFAVSAWSKSFVGLPFVDGGRARGGIDCWGLCRLAWAEVFHLDVPDYAILAADLRDVARAIGAGRAGADWLVVERERLRDGDAVLMFGHAGERLARVETHVGLFVGPRHLLHVEEGTASVVVPLAHRSVSWRLARFYRHRALA